MKRLEINYTLNAIDALVSLARYNFVNRTINDKSRLVLDFGCGSGYGSRVLKEHFEKVKSYDIFPDGYLPSDLDICQDITELKTQKFDVITCFEVIEHMDEKSQDDLMQTLIKMLNKNGVLFISTVRKMSPPPTENRRKEHIRELDFQELLEYCETNFNNVFTFGQIDQVISTFHKDNHYHFVFICSCPKLVK
jgi:2-polyprenyl-3-methyl-5-hydroxy-6-metoxy-1,4-benzoquinol methylase